jgi:alcohol dehydrogenase class IV
MDKDPANLSFQHVEAELRLFCGELSLAALARELSRQGCKRVLVVCGRSMGSSGAMEVLRKSLGPVLVGESNAVRSNSPLPAVQEVADALQQTQADAVVAVGGGSAAVTSRAASILLAEMRPAQELCTRRLSNGEFESPRLQAAKLPQFIVPTTPSNAFVKAGSAIHDPESGHRLALFDTKTRPKGIFLHPAFLATSPTKLVQSASLNTLSTAVEALESPKCDPLSEAMLMHCVRLIARHLGEDDIDTRQRLALAAIMCGRGTEQSGGGLASVLAHAIGHRANVANGIVNAIVLPHTLRFNAPVTQPVAARIRESMAAPGQEHPGGHAELLESLLSRLPIARRLREIGVARDDLSDIAQAAMSDYFISRNPRQIASADEVQEILERAW